VSKCGSRLLVSSPGVLLCAQLPVPLAALVARQLMWLAPGCSLPAAVPCGVCLSAVSDHGAAAAAAAACWQPGMVTR
jgi:hypothetical protein